MSIPGTNKLKNLSKTTLNNNQVNNLSETVLDNNKNKIKSKCSCRVLSESKSNVFVL